MIGLNLIVNNVSSSLQNTPIYVTFPIILIQVRELSKNMLLEKVFCISFQISRNQFVMMTIYRFQV